MQMKNDSINNNNNSTFAGVVIKEEVDMRPNISARIKEISPMGDLKIIFNATMQEVAKGKRYLQAE